MVGMRWRGPQGLPRGIFAGVRVAVACRLADGGDRPPERIVALPIPPRDQPVGHRHVHERVETCGLMEIVALVGSHDAGDPTPGIIWGLEPEVREMRLVGRARRT